MLNQSRSFVFCMPLRTLIVDDEPIARRVLREKLELINDVELVAEADNGEKALERISELKPDLVLLDLQMPVMGGLEVVRRLKGGRHMPVVVIVTAYDKFAIQAFEAGAIDYLLKPIGQERLAQAVERAKQTSRRETFERIAQLQRDRGPFNRTTRKENRGTGRRRVLPFGRQRDLRIPSGWRRGLDHHGQT